MRMAGRLGALLVLMLEVSLVVAQSNLPVPAREEDVFNEAKVSYPAFPAAKSLLQFPTDWTSNAIFVDRDTLTVGGDGVVRFALVVRSPSGAENVSFEGLRCATGERRVYAHGRRTGDVGSWVPARNSDWQPILDRRINRCYFEFWRDVFCEGRAVEARDAILRHVARGGKERAVGTPSE